MLSPTEYLRAYRDAHGGRVSASERVGVHRAFADLDRGSGVLPRVALGAAVGINQDWPRAMREAAMEEYGLAEPGPQPAGGGTPREAAVVRAARRSRA